jgi:hypothetical protein
VAREALAEGLVVHARVRRDAMHIEHDDPPPEPGPEAKSEAGSGRTGPLNRASTPNGSRSRSRPRRCRTGTPSTEDGSSVLHRSPIARLRARSRPRPAPGSGGWCVALGLGVRERDSGVPVLFPIDEAARTQR